MAQTQVKARDVIDIHHLTAVVDGIPDVRGSGIVFRRGSLLTRVRRQPAGGSTIVFELHERTIPAGILTTLSERRGPYRDAPNFSTARRPDGWSVMKPDAPHVSPASLVPAAGASVPKRSGGTSVADEWRALGFNCGGAALSWIGVVGSGAAAPVTGGLTFGAALLLYAGAAASSVQCTASVYRMWNIHRQKKSINDSLDASPTYKWTMLGLDGIGLAGAGGALKEAYATQRAYGAARTTWGGALQRTISPAQRRQVAGLMGLRASTVGSRVLSRLTRQKLLDGAGGVLGIASSADGGVIRELIVWVTTEETAK